MRRLIAWLWAWWFAGERARTFGAARSARWGKVRAEHLQRESCCQVCGRRELLNVHHVQPFHLFPSLELEPRNLITLCEGPTGCHLLLGHLGNWERWNPEVREDAAHLWLKIAARRKDANQSAGAVPGL